ncbi:hypothetical protein GOP47_0017523 [Adiantum capillus-veneris]|uniref:Trichome birefringence-like N-terminal domain-containing protein n=1 Tax=Adiantum capillus-veneris TaxID=13818 RepID=A0A9D4UFL4_ADICA|nr:hypothetical protein GOP47_0017523 [Adiantum capillus-veneris]
MAYTNTLLANKEITLSDVDNKKMVVLKARNCLRNILDSLYQAIRSSRVLNIQSQVSQLVRKPFLLKASMSGFRICGICGSLLLVLLIFMFTLFYLDVVHLVSAPGYSSGILLNAAAIRSLARLNEGFVYVDEHPRVLSSSQSFSHKDTRVEQNNPTAQDTEDLHSVNKGLSPTEIAGKWIQDQSYPLYDSEACLFIDPGFRCQENGRPDQDYLRWRWQPSRCDLPRFKASEILERLRGKRVVFVGDSIGRNQWESMLCMLASGVQNKSRVYEANGQAISKHTGFLSFVFRDFNLSVEYYRSPFLVPHSRPPAGANPNVTSTLLLDFMDWSSKHWLPSHLLIFNTGHWWSYEKLMRSGCYFRVGDHANMSMTVGDGFNKAMQTWRNWVAKTVDLTSTQIFLRGYAPAHFSNGTWKTGGECHEETQPWPEGTRFEEVYWTNEHMASAVESLQELEAGGAAVKLLNITGLSSYRKDAHSSIYNVGREEPRPMHRQDCSHWCLPGLPDVWNELLFASLSSSLFPFST